MGEYPTSVPGPSPCSAHRLIDGLLKGWPPTLALLGRIRPLPQKHKARISGL